MTEISFIDETQAKEAIFDVRNDKTLTNWCLFTYENSKSNKIILLGKGSGGVSELKEFLKDDIVCYGLIRKTDQIDDSTTVKFAFLFWLGEKVPRMQKARISVQQGIVKKWIGQYHVDLSCNTLNEISDEIVEEKIRDTSGSASRVLDKTTGNKIGVYSSTKTNQTTISKGDLTFVNESELKEALKDIRSNSGINWILMSYEGDSNNIILIGKGTGGVEEFLSHLNDEMVGYGLIRKIEKIDESETIKFAFIRFVGDNIPRMLKARLGTHFGTITKFFHPYHVSLDVTQKDEINDEIIMSTIKAASGTKNNVLKDNVNNRNSFRLSNVNQKPTPANTTNTSSQPIVPKVLGQDQSIKFVNEASLKQDIKDVRDDNNDINWCLFGFEGKKGNVIISLGKGNGGVNELVSHLEDDMVGYGLVRKVDKIDDSLTVKFVFINWVGEKIDRMHKARLGTYKGAIQALFSPYHTDLNCSQKSEINDEVIMQRIQDASGSGSKVRN